MVLSGPLSERIVLSSYSPSIPVSPPAPAMEAPHYAVICTQEQIKVRMGFVWLHLLTRLPITAGSFTLDETEEKGENHGHSARSCSQSMAHQSKSTL